MRLRRCTVIAGILVPILLVSACGSGGSNTAPAIKTQPHDQTVIAGQTANFSVKATGKSPLSYQWQKNGSAISGATAANYTTPATTLADSGTQFSVVVTNSLGSATSSNATLTVNAGSSAIDVLTYHNDNARTGQNLNESILTTTNVASATFGKLGFYTTNAKVDAEPLIVSGVSVPGKGTLNLLIAASENDTVYAFDADNPGTQIWSANMLKSGETTSDDRGCNQVSPQIGVTATPVIDRSRGPNGAIYVAAMSKNGSTYHQRLHALDLALGTELFGGPVEVQATYPGTGDNSSGGNVIFEPGQYKERAGLLMLNGTLYTSWASHCDYRPYTGWIMAYDPSTLAQTAVLNVTPNGNEGSNWASGAGLAADSSGNIYYLVANGTFDTTLNNGFPADGDYGNAFIKLSTSGKLAVADYFEMDNQASENGSDTDLGSSGAMLLPDITSGGQTLHLAVGAGKDGNLYVVNRDSMGKFNPSNNNSVYQEFSGIFSGGGVFSAPAYFNNTVYYGPVGGPITAFPISNGKLASGAKTSHNFGFPGASPSISANGTNNAILWAIENSSTAVLHAYDATNLNELYNSNQAGSRDQFGAGNKFMTPMIANGKVYVGTQTGVAVFGLLP